MYRVHKLPIPGLARADKTLPRRAGVTLKPPRFVTPFFFFPSRERIRSPSWSPSSPRARRASFILASPLGPLRDGTAIVIREVCERFLFPSFVNATSTSSPRYYSFLSRRPSPRPGTSTRIVVCHGERSMHVTLFHSPRASSMRLRGCTRVRTRRLPADRICNRSACRASRFPASLYARQLSVSRIWDALQAVSKHPACSRARNEINLKLRFNNVNSRRAALIFTLY